MISIDGGMPQHGHGFPTQPRVTRELGDGRYLLEGMKFSMPGWWEIKLKVDAASGTDEVTSIDHRFQSARRPRQATRPHYLDPRAMKSKSGLATRSAGRARARWRGRWPVPSVLRASMAGASDEIATLSSIRLSELAACAEGSVERLRILAGRSQPWRAHFLRPPVQRQRGRCPAQVATSRTSNSRMAGRWARAWAPARGAPCRSSAPLTVRFCSGTAARTACGRRRWGRSKIRLSMAATGSPTRIYLKAHYRAEYEAVFGAMPDLSQAAEESESARHAGTTGCMEHMSEERRQGVRSVCQHGQGAGGATRKPFSTASRAWTGISKACVEHDPAASAGRSMSRKRMGCASSSARPSASPAITARC